MTQSSIESNKFQWKWVGITFVLYFVFYLLPIVAALSQRLASHGADIFLGIWIFGGIIVIAGISGYLSKGVTLWEPAIAGVGIVVLVFGYSAVRIISASVGHRFSVFYVIGPLIMTALTVFLLSLLGAWLGEYAQKLWRSQE